MARKKKVKKELELIDLDEYDAFTVLRREQELFDRARRVGAPRMLRKAAVSMVLWTIVMLIPVLTPVHVAMGGLLYGVTATAMFAMLIYNMLSRNDSAHYGYPEFLSSTPLEWYTDPDFPEVIRYIVWLTCLLAAPIFVCFDIARIMKGHHLAPPKGSALNDLRRNDIERIRELAESWNEQFELLEDLELAAEHGIGSAASVVDELRAQLRHDRETVDRHLAYMDGALERKALGELTSGTQIDASILRLESAKENLEGHNSDLRARIAAARETSTFRSG